MGAPLPASIDVKSTVALESNVGCSSGLRFVIPDNHISICREHAVPRDVILDSASAIPFYYQGNGCIFHFCKIGLRREFLLPAPGSSGRTNVPRGASASMKLAAAISNLGWIGL